MTLKSSWNFRFLNSLITSVLVREKISTSLGLNGTLIWKKIYVKNGVGWEKKLDLTVSR